MPIISHYSGAILLLFGSKYCKYYSLNSSCELLLSSHYLDGHTLTCSLWYSIKPVSLLAVNMTSSNHHQDRRPRACSGRPGSSVFTFSALDPPSKRRSTRSSSCTPWFPCYSPHYNLQRRFPSSRYSADVQWRVCHSSNLWRLIADQLASLFPTMFQQYLLILLVDIALVATRIAGFR